MRGYRKNVNESIDKAKIVWYNEGVEKIRKSDNILYQHKRRKRKL